MSDFMDSLIGDTKKEISDTENRLRELRKFHNIINPKTRGSSRKEKIQIVSFPKEIMTGEIMPYLNIDPNILYTTKSFGISKVKNEKTPRKKKIKA